MIDFVCTSNRAAEVLKQSAQLKLLLKHLEQEGVSAKIWIEGKDQPVFTQICDRRRPGQRLHRVS